MHDRDGALVPRAYTCANDGNNGARNEQLETRQKHIDGVADDDDERLSCSLLSLSLSFFSWNKIYKKKIKTQALAPGTPRPRP